MYDVAIIGAGVIGASVARELSKYDLNVVVIEKENDVSNGTTKANSAIVHAGYDAHEGTLMAKYNALGNAMFDKICDELSVPFERCGSLVLAFSEEEREHLDLLYKRGIVNNIPEMELLEKDEIKKLEPNISDEVVAALHAKTAGIVGPWELTIAMLENAAENGVNIELNQDVVDIEKLETGYRIITQERNFEAKVVINASGVYADKIHNMVSEETFKIKPRRGQYFVMDKTQGELVGQVIFQCPTELGKGILVTPTVHGNLLLGPDAQDMDDRDDISTTTEQLEFVKEHAVKSVPGIHFRESIRSFAGLRAEGDRGDFIIEEAPGAPLFFDVAGIKSPGLSAAPAIGLDVAKMAVEKLGEVKEKSDFNPKREQIIFMELNAEEKKELIKENPQYGRVICRCENITEGEIVSSIHRKVGARTVDGVKKRCRPGMGRCQGGFCGPRVQEILARELNVSLEEVVLDKKNSYILTGETK
ncbi:NAD(P)/FAD-dependent oxidoreductase [Ilyobacter polytropus]|uniref:FAD dependent oxidoreductase n=1 Tax=Ilyobacter polytropus (strain ATCC 51220 / DSM 2926 / LMG 16218 / CuHBu1) TaxID=572544 RepID=E3H8W3_ILYPC|nr:NAD(P)/FAD-dependent oxidoreductase [Ilyobacter polytropus]ADO83511.1 FAD dependent oxidoreductase [Ilyobacter polytropus DSM 2926]ADO83517.1 FAD dependent oxidoreductase [Ilyobacter polytropus DSM 2926]